MITGCMLRDAFISAFHNISNRRTEIDALNVFPVPDGDTGTNMTMTIGTAAAEVARLPDSVSLADAADCAASALLRGARGNSGVILSLIFRGFSDRVRHLISADASALAAALQAGADTAYQAVMNPTEGTILTVIKAAADAAQTQASLDPDATRAFSCALAGAKTALDETPNLLPILKTSGVVDAGGYGLVTIFEGMRAVFEDGQIVAQEETSQMAVAAPTTPFSTADADIRFIYCTELLIRRAADCTRSPADFRDHLATIGDCAVLVEDADIIKIHVHTNDPGDVLQRAIAFGELIHIKIENMRQQHANAAWGASSAPAEPPAEATKPFGAVAVAAGEGVEAMFREIGVDAVVAGGQTMNPSTDELLSAIDRVPASHVFIFPNNKNIILTARQTVPLTEKQVHVIPSVSVPQGITAVLALDETVSAEENCRRMTDAMRRVDTGLVTFAVRDSVLNGNRIRKGQILGLENGEITVVDGSAAEAAFHVVSHLVKETTEFITVFSGQDVSDEEADALCARLEFSFDTAQVTVLPGGQPVYHYIISVE